MRVRIWTPCSRGGDVRCRWVNLQETPREFVVRTSAARTGRTATTSCSSLSSQKRSGREVVVRGNGRDELAKYFVRSDGMGVVLGEHGLKVRDEKIVRRIVALRIVKLSNVVHLDQHRLSPQPGSS